MRRNLSTRMRPGRFLAALCLVATACSSTAQNQPPSASPQAEVSVPTTAAGKPLPFSASSTRARGDHPRPQQSSSLDTIARQFVAATPTPGGATIAAPRRAAMGPGVTGNSITVGVPISLDTAEYQEDVGYDTSQQLGPDELKRAYRAVKGAINATGGILGRRLRLEFFTFNWDDYSTFAELERDMCTYFTDEHEIFALDQQFGASLTACMEANDVVSYVGSPTPWADAATFQRFPHLVSPGGMTLDRQAAIYIQGLFAQDFFRRSDKIGLVSWNDPTADRVIRGVIEPALKRKGFELADNARVEPQQGPNDWQRAVLEAESIIVGWKATGINKVLVVAGQEAKTIMFLADKHDYHPAYGIYSAIGGTAHLTDDEAQSQLRGAVGVGWVPMIDVGAKRGLRASNPAAHRCRALMTAHGLDAYNSSGRAHDANWICDFGLFLKAVIEAGAPAITADSAIAGAGRLGTSFQAAATFATRVAPGRRDGAAAFRFVRFFSGCGCFRYTSPLFDAG